MSMNKATAHHLEQLYLDHHEALSSFLKAKSGDSVLVADMVQDTFLKLYAFLNSGKELTNPRGWLFRVARNILIDHYRKNGHDVQELKAELPSNESAHRHGPEDCLLGIIASLPDKYKKAVYLVDVKGERQIDAARRLNLSLSTFKSHVQRGRKLVMKGYVECCNYTINKSGYLEGEVKDGKECMVCSHN